MSVFLLVVKLLSVTVKVIKRKKPLVRYVYHLVCGFTPDINCEGIVVLPPWALYNLFLLIWITYTHTFVQ